MRHSGWYQAIKAQRGFTLIELVVALAISGSLVTVIVMSIFQISSASTSSVDHMTAISHAQNAGQWFGVDVAQADTVSVGASDGFPLVLSRTQYDGTHHEVTYDITGSELRRSYSVDGGAPTETLIAGNVNASGTSCQLDDGVLVLTVATESGQGPQQKTETRVYKASPRPSGT